ncbi:hypothetical protein ABER98_01740 [Domibacillus aminovorans]|uniref:hypothetical protein n=1 Tax=Domibacillus aminovorans TaxID=29332 RepID=UPI003D21DD71
MVNFKDFVETDIQNTFFNTNEFASEAVIDNVTMNIVADDHELKKYNLKAEGEGLARGELLFYAPVSLFMNEPFIGMEVTVDGTDYSALSVTESMGVYEIVLEGYHS